MELLTANQAKELVQNTYSGDLEKVIKAIADRIKAEYTKHKTLDWAYIAAKKIFYSYEIVRLNEK